MRLQRNFVELSNQQLAEIIKQPGVTVFRRQVKAWRAPNGWFLLDQVLGKEDVITYALALDNDGTVRGLEILVCEALYDAIRRPTWRARFLGKRADSLNLAADVDIVSGQTLSMTHVAEGVKRLLFTYKLALARLPRTKG